MIGKSGGIAAWIKLNRESGLSQSQLPNKLYVWQPQISAWESKKAVPSREIIQKLTAILGAETDKTFTIGLGEWLRDQREKLGLSRNKLAEKVDISPGTIYFMEIGKT